MNDWALAVALTGGLLGALLKLGTQTDRGLSLCSSRSWSPAAR